jgi:hypothetical protein
VRIRLWFACVVVVWMGLLAAAAQRSPVDLVVHEWGTFLAMNDSDGVSLDGMYHEEHALPAFVHARSKDQLRLRSAVIKGETPVIYFYAQNSMRLRVRVGFPRGAWTQWYPQADLVGPSVASIGTPLSVRNGHITWTVDVVPPKLATAALPSTSADALWNHARQVDASYVSAVDHSRRASPKEWERFIFYRGLGEAELPIAVNARRGRITASASVGVRHIYVLRVESGQGAYSYIPALEAGKTIADAIPTMAATLPLDRFVERLTDDLAGRLVESGLYEKEARAMVNTWRGSYFTTEGVRVLFVLPQSWTDRFIPLEITPEPATIVRVMIGRVEVLTPERERRTERAIRDLAFPDPSRREKAFASLRNEGRYIEPIVRRTLRTTADEQVRALCRRLLLTDFVTELRTSLTDAATGGVRPQHPVYTRAQLAGLLREIGLTDEARQEGEAALAALELMPRPQMSRHESRHMFRALARAHEGAGHDKMALKWYGDFVKFGSQAQRCAGCHQTEGPRDMFFFRDWWAGRKFAEYAHKTGEAARLIARHEAALSQDPRNVATRMALAYLYEARGDSVRSAALWSEIDPGRR